jgi:hypothetical protein
MILRLGSLALALAPIAVGPQAPTDPGSPQQSNRKDTIVVTATYEPAPLEESDRSVDVVDVSDSPTLFRN